jgi:hypothetical protein
MKNITQIITVTLFALNLSFAGCGSCSVPKKTAIIPSSQDLVADVGENGAVSGLVRTSCGMCNFGMKNQKSCSLAIQIGENSYDVEGTIMSEHGDSHAKDGMCNAVRVANVVGTIKNNVFLAEEFELRDN